MIKLLSLFPLRERPPNVHAKKITGRPYLSHSQLSMMRTCPRKFAFQYVEKVPPDFLPSSLLFGASIHSALELHFRCLLEGLTATPEALLSAYLEAWHRCIREARPGTPIRYNKGEDIGGLFTLAERIISSFLLSEVASPVGQVLGVEEELKVTMSQELPDVLAKVDLVYADSKALHVVDFKTSRSRWNDQKLDDATDQLLLYARTVEGMSQNLALPVKLHFAVVTKAKKPVMQLLDAPADAPRLAAVEENVAQVWDAILHGNFYASPSPMNCCLCPFKSRCPAHIS